MSDYINKLTVHETSHDIHDARISQNEENDCPEVENLVVDDELTCNRITIGSNEAIEDIGEGLSISSQGILHSTVASLYVKEMVAFDSDGNNHVNLRSPLPRFVGNRLVIIFQGSMMEHCFELQLLYDDTGLIVNPMFDGEKQELYLDSATLNDRSSEGSIITFDEQGIQLMFQDVDFSQTVRATCYYEPIVGIRYEK